jgi:hypothetical protein
MGMTGFEQAVIKVEKERQFQDLKGVIEAALSAENIEQFLKRLEGGKVRIRDFGSVLNEGFLGAQTGAEARNLYQSLTMSDQAQMREFYLSRIEDVDSKLRAKFHKLYQYY